MPHAELEMWNAQEESSLRIQVCALFKDAQHSTVVHRKLIANLKNLQQSALRDVSDSNDDRAHMMFVNSFIACAVRIMGVKKSESVGDRLVKFISLFFRITMEQEALREENEVDDGDVPTTEAALHFLVRELLVTINRFLRSRDRTIRYRATQLVSQIVCSIDAIDDELYSLLKVNLLRRMRDREQSVRIHAAIGLGRLAANEDDSLNPDTDDDYEDTPSINLSSSLLAMLQNDPCAEVRRTLMLNLPLTPKTLVYLLERARDVDCATRKVLYSRLLPALGDFRHLSLSMRDKLLRWGLRDRDAKVRDAMARVFAERWIQNCTPADEHDSEDDQTMSTVSMAALLELLERIDVLNSAGTGGIAHDAMREFWTHRRDYLNELVLGDTFWDDLTPESAFLARSLNDHLLSSLEVRKDSAFEEKIPEVTRLTFYLERVLKQLVESQTDNVAMLDSEEQQLVETEFVAEQLLCIALTLDYTDEIGRRKMFTLMRNILPCPHISNEVTRLMVEVLRVMFGSDAKSEGEFCGLILEAIAETYDTIAEDEAVCDPEDSFHSAQSSISAIAVARTFNKVALTEEELEAKTMKEMVVNLKCLHIARSMLQNIDGRLQQNIHLVTMLNDLIVPAVRSHEAPIREAGITCLGLCCLLDKNLAEENMSLFLHCFGKGHEQLQINAIHIIADIVEMHPSLLRSSDDNSDLHATIVKMFSKGMKSQRTGGLQLAAVVALSKLALTSILVDDDLLRRCVVLFCNPECRDNLGVSQALSYFLPVFCFSKFENMLCMARVGPSILREVADLLQDVETYEDNMSINDVINMLLDWTDSRRQALPNATANTLTQHVNIEGQPHFVFAETCLCQALDDGRTKWQRKSLITAACKIYVSPKSSPDHLASLKTRVEAVLASQSLTSDAVSRNALNKLLASLDSVANKHTQL